MRRLEEIRGRTSCVRERTLRAASALEDPPPKLLPLLGGSAVLGALTSASGAFGTADITPALRTALLEAVFVAGAVIHFSLLSLVPRWSALGARPWLARAAVCAGSFLALTLISWTLGLAFQGAQTPPLHEFAGPVLLVVTAAAALGLPRSAPRPPAAPATGGGLAARLPHRMRGAALYALRAEDHYVRVYTSAGEHLLLMPLERAIEALANADGGRTHRSWWVARSAIRDVRRGHGRATLTLANGVEAPVSRRYSPRLRESGWY